MFETSSQDEALDYIKRVYDAKFAVVRTSEPFRMTHSRTDYGPWTSDTMHLDAGGIHAEPYGSVSICRQNTGRVQLTVGRDTLAVQKGDLLAATLLSTFPNTLLTQPSDLAARTDVSTTVSLALDFVARNADLPITCSDIAAYSWVSRRTPEMAF